MEMRPYIHPFLLIVTIIIDHHPEQQADVGRKQLR
jgi:nanoRNase/pAp phosphatase (c-di-AMP/oligoRNAs hydrolase)